MGYNIEFQIGALIFWALIVGVFFSREKIKTIQNQMYGMLLLSAGLMLISDIVSVILLTHADQHRKWALIWGHAYIFSILFTLGFVSAYTISLIMNREHPDQKHLWIMRLSIIIFTTAAIVSLFLDINNNGSGRRVYTYGPCVSLAYVFGAIVIVFMLVFTLFHCKKISLKQQIPVYSYSVVMGLVALIQNHFQYLLLTSFAMTIVIIFIFFSLENPDIRMIQALNEAKAEAERANKAKSSFLANMSHEIRTPINAVLGMDEMILREATEPQIIEYAHNIKKSGRTLLSVVNDVLDFSKIESGKLEIIPVEYQLSDVFMDMIHMSKLRAVKKGLEFRVEVDSDIPNLLIGDDVRIRQIITNLLTNAIKYTHKGTITLRLKKVMVSMKEKRMVFRVEVEDTGIGIKSEDIDKLMESFTRIEEEKNRNIEGTGLGMNITMNLLGLMNSALEVQSEYGKGSLFAFELEQGLRSDENIGKLTEQSFEDGNHQTDTDYVVVPDARILVVDDNSINLAVISGLLKRSKAQVDLVDRGAKALIKLEEKEYDLIFLDHMMPEMDGVETLAEIKKRWPERNTPVVALTANAISGMREQYLAWGFDDYISKPIDIATLEKCLRTYLVK